MTTDTFSNWRKPPIQPRSPFTAGEDNGPYLAFHAKDRVASLEIRRSNIIDVAPYSSQALTRYDRKGTNFAIAFSLIIVLVRGKNLYQVFAALKEGTAEFIEEFDSARWPDHQHDPKAPFIESINVTATLDGPKLGDSELSFGPSKDRKFH
jgi:hypothetical protein